MNRFRFRLESLEKLRTHEFELAQRAWQLLESERQARVQAIERLGERLDRGRVLLAKQLDEGSDSSRLSLAADAIATGRLQVERAATELAQWMPTLEKARAAMTQARTRLKSLERLREKQSQRHRAQAARLEQEELDDLAQRKSVSRLDASVRNAS